MVVFHGLASTMGMLPGRAGLGSALGVRLLPSYVRVRDVGRSPGRRFAPCGAAFRLAGLAWRGRVGVPAVSVSAL